MNVKKLKIHEAASLIPALAGAQFDALEEDIKTNGQKVPIVIKGKTVLDGKARLEICKKLGITPIFVEAAANDVPERVVISLNLHRRHLPEGLRSMLAARLANLKLGANQHTQGGLTQQQAANDLGVSVDAVQRAQKVRDHGDETLIKSVETGKLNVSTAAVIATLPKAEQKKLLEAANEDLILGKAKEIRKKKAAIIRGEREAQHQEISKGNQPPPDGKLKYQVIYADPPWDYLGTKVPYPTMTQAEICAVNASTFAEKDAVLMLWTSACLLPQALEVIKAWGFEFKTGAVWDKQKAGTGSYWRIQHEHLLLATRGKPLMPSPKAVMSSVIRAKKTAHSAKPVEAYEMIEKMYPQASKMELFARGKARQDWHVWGNQAIPSAAQLAQEKAARLAVSGNKVVPLTQSGQTQPPPSKTLEAVQKGLKKVAVVAKTRSAR